jgi:hypothetical protein
MTWIGMSGGVGTNRTRAWWLAPVYLLTILLGASTATSCAPAPAAVSRVKIPNTSPEVTVALPDGWEVDSDESTQGPTLTLRRVRTSPPPWRMFPQLTVQQWQPPSSVASLRAALAWDADRAIKREHVPIDFRVVEGAEIAYWSRNSRMIVDFAGGTGANIPMKSHSAAVTAGGRFFHCIVQRDDDSMAVANDVELVTRVCAHIRVAPRGDRDE